MKKIDQDKTLLHEVSVNYRNFKRDTLVLWASVFGLITLVVYFIQKDWIHAVVVGGIAMLIFGHESVVTKQLFKLSFYDKEQKTVFVYSWFMVIRSIEVSYADLSYKIIIPNKYSKYKHAGQLLIYNQGRLLFRTGLDKYGWTNGLEQEAIKLIKFRNIKFIK